MKIQILQNHVFLLTYILVSRRRTLDRFFPKMPAKEQKKKQQQKTKKKESQKTLKTKQTNKQTKTKNKTKCNLYDVYFIFLN